MSCRILLACIFLCACSPRMMETNLYFGQTRPDGSPITAEEWRNFKEKQINNVFKEGNTVINVEGNWYDPVKKQLITEPTYVIIYFHHKSAKTSRQIDSLKQWYKNTFQQQSVLRVDKKVKATF